MAKSKREEVADVKADGEYEFKLPAFDEKAFVRREVLSARASFITVGLGVAAGILATLIQRIAGQAHWYFGWVALVASLLVLRPLLQRMKFPEEVTAPKALFGSLFMLFFTGLAIWVIGVNFA